MLLAEAETNQRAKDRETERKSDEESKKSSESRNKKQAAAKAKTVSSYSIGTPRSATDDRSIQINTHTSTDYCVYVCVCVSQAVISYSTGEFLNSTYYRQPVNVTLT